VAQLSGYFDRYKARLNLANAAQLQQLSRLASLFLDCLRQHSSGPGNTAHQATLAAPSSSSSSSAAGAAPGCRVLTCSRFLIDLSIDNINLFPLLEWLRESKVLFKVSGYAASAAQAAGSVQRQRPAPQAAAAAAAEAPEPEVRESLPSLHAFVGFLQALTNTNTDGRIIIDCQAQQASTKQAAASAPAGTGPGTTSEARPGSNSSARSSLRAAPVAQLRFVLLNAAGHFSKILQGARSVVLASGTLAPVEALRAQLFPAVPDKGIRHFECGHVIDAGNLVALAVGKGPSGAALDFR
jgi:chromosome transmission fidelity protein 1